MIFFAVSPVFAGLICVHHDAYVSSSLERGHDLNATKLLLIAMLSTSVSVILRKAIIGRMHPLQFEVVSNVMHLTLSLIAYSLIGIKYQHMTPATIGIAFSQVVMGFITVLAFTFAISSGNNLGASTAVMSASPVVTFALSMLCYGEKLDMRTALGILMVIAGTTLVSSR